MLFSLRLPQSINLSHNTLYSLELNKYLRPINVAAIIYHDPYDSYFPVDEVIYLRIMVINEEYPYLKELDGYDDLDLLVTDLEESVTKYIETKVISLNKELLRDLTYEREIGKNLAIFNTNTRYLLE